MNSHPTTREQKRKKRGKEEKRKELHHQTLAVGIRLDIFYIMKRKTHFFEWTITRRVADLGSSPFTR